MKMIRAFSAILLAAFLFTSCEKRNDDRVDREQANMAVITTALDSFVATLIANPPSTADLSVRIRTYLNTHPTSFYGSTVTLFDDKEQPYFSPYLFRRYGNIETANLMEPSYKIDSQLWLRKPVDSHLPIWTDAYYDAGGGEIWMRTRSVPIFLNGKIFAVATTDLAIEKP